MLKRQQSVRRYVRQAKVKLNRGGQKAFIPGFPDAGLEAEMDWGEFTAVIVCESKRLKLFCLRSKYSGKCFIRAYYTFETRFCNPGEGHRKGGVEGLIGFARRNFLVSVPKWAA